MLCLGKRTGDVSCLVLEESCKSARYDSHVGREISAQENGAIWDKSYVFDDVIHYVADSFPVIVMRICKNWSNAVDRVYKKDADMGATPRAVRVLRTIDNAINGGYVAILSWVFSPEGAIVISDGKLSKSMKNFLLAIDFNPVGEKGYIHVAEWVHRCLWTPKVNEKNRWDFDFVSVAAACNNGQIAYLKWAESVFPDCTIKQGSDLQAIAVNAGYLSVAKHLRGQGHHWNTCSVGLTYRKINTLCDDDALELLEWAHFNLCSWGNRTLKALIVHNRIPLLNILLDKGCRFEWEKLMKYALYTGDEKITDAVWTTVQRREPASYLSSTMFRFTLLAPIPGGVKWLCDRGVSWGRDESKKLTLDFFCSSTLNTYKKISVSVLRFAIEHGFPLNVEAVIQRGPWFGVEDQESFDFVVWLNKWLLRVHARGFTASGLFRAACEDFGEKTFRWLRGNSLMVNWHPTEWEYMKSVADENLVAFLFLLEFPQRAEIDWTKMFARMLHECVHSWNRMTMNKFVSYVLQERLVAVNDDTINYCLNTFADFASMTHDVPKEYYRNCSTLEIVICLAEYAVSAGLPLNLRTETKVALIRFCIFCPQNLNVDSIIRALFL